MIRTPWLSRLKRRLRLFYAAREWWTWFQFYRSTGFRGEWESAKMALGVTAVIMGWRRTHPEQSRGK